jgi:alpha-1,2-mannosyltransferase
VSINGRKVIEMRRGWSALLGATVLLGLAADVGGRHEPVGVDFHTYEAAARIGLQQGWTDIYDQGVVAMMQKVLVPTQHTQPFLSTPPVAWIVSWLTPFPYPVSLALWAALMLLVFAGALALTTSYRGPARALAVGAALVPWWVLTAVYVGQVAPLIAATVLISWRLLRDDRDIAAGLVLVAILLKPNTALLAPLALLAMGRIRAFSAWFVAAAIVVGVSLMTIGPHGTSAYLFDLGHLPSGASSLTLHDAFGLGGIAATAVRGLIVIAAMVGAYWMRARPGLALALAVLASLLIAPYLHGSDLCLLVSAGWIVWHELPTPAWRVWLAALWVIATPFTFSIPYAGLPLVRWPILEGAMLIAMMVVAWRSRGRERPPARLALTPKADFSRQAPA